MKKLTLFTALAIVAMLFASCKKNDYTKFIGTWGVEKLEYYNTDYAGNPIVGSLMTYVYDPNSTDNGIQIIFRENKSGEMRDSAIDTLRTNWNEETETYDSYIYCPDTVMVYKFTYSYDKSETTLYMNIDYGTNMRTFRMYIENMTDNSFTYENEYDKDYMEKAYLKRISNTTSKSTSRQVVKHPHMPGSFIGGR